MLLNFKVFVLLLITGIFALSAMTGQAVAQTGGNGSDARPDDEDEPQTYILDFKTSVDEEVGKETYKNSQAIAVASSAVICNDFNETRVYRYTIKFCDEKGEEVAGSINFSRLAPGKHKPELSSNPTMNVPENADYGHVTVSAVLEVKLGKAWIVLDARNQTFKPDGSDGPDDLPGGLGGL